ncbi:MAG: nucleotidyltransferase substrate binding protein [Draconibacterium sp.]
MNEKTVRWKQRFQNFEKAFFQLKEAVERFDELTDLEKEGMIQRFEFTFELSWKTLKDFLESQNVEAKFPRDVIKEAFHYEIIENGEVWLEMLEIRNLMSHTYDEETFKRTANEIFNRFYTEISRLYQYLNEKSS